jgi:acylaminoacyl-peptidase
MIDSLIYRFDKNGYLKPGNYHVFVVPVEGGTARQITSGNFNYGFSDFRAGNEPEWTPDSTHILTVANRHPDHEDRSIPRFTKSMSKIAPSRS